MLHELQTHVLFYLIRQTNNDGDRIELCLMQSKLFSHSNYSPRESIYIVSDQLKKFPDCGFLRIFIPSKLKLKKWHYCCIILLSNTFPFLKCCLLKKKKKKPSMFSIIPNSFQYSVQTSVPCYKRKHIDCLSCLQDLSTPPTPPSQKQFGVQFCSHNVHNASVKYGKNITEWQKEKGLK